MALGITETTAYASPYTVGDTITYGFTATGGAGGPYTWVFGVIDANLASVSGADTATGASVTFTGSLDAVSATSQFLVEVQDAAGGPAWKTKVTSAVTVNPAVVPVRSSNGNVTDDDAGVLTKANTTGGNVTLTFTVAAASRKFLQFTFKNHTGANNLILAPLAGDTIDGGASITLTPGQSTTLYSDNLSDWTSK